MSVYGTVTYTLKLRNFSWNRALYTPPLRRRKSSLRSDLCVPDLPKTRPHGTNLHPIAGCKYSNPSLHRMCIGQGILTLCPSGAAFAIPLGPTNPWLIFNAKETLIFRRAGISPALWLLVPTFLLRNAPVWVTPLPSVQMRILSYQNIYSKIHTFLSFGTKL